MRTTSIQVQDLPEGLYPCNAAELSKGMAQVYSMVEMVSKTQTSVILRGETGTEKEEIAHLIYSTGTRSKGPFIKFSFSLMTNRELEAELFGYESPAKGNAAESRMGLFELANHGTLFLDGIEKISIGIQAKLLGVLKDQEFPKPGTGKMIRTDIRFIAATSQILENEVKAGRFNEELYYCLNIISIVIPKLKYRCEEIPMFVNGALKSFNKRNGTKIKYISAEALKFLMNNPWSGNLAEIKNVLERACTLCPDDTLTLELFSKPDKKNEIFKGQGKNLRIPSIPSSRRLPEAVAILEKEMIKEALQKAQGVQSHASEMLGITMRMLGYKLTQYNLRGSATLRRRPRRFTLTDKNNTPPPPTVVSTSE